MTDNFYGEVLADHNLHPLHRHDLPDATHVCKGLNPTCGDDIELHLDIHDGVITDGSFTGLGCAISQASADIMLELIIGALQNVSKMPARVKCAMLSWNTMEKLLNGGES